MQGQNPSLSAQYYNSNLSVWISVDPMVDKYPNLSPYVYCADNPVRLVDEDGREIDVPDDRPFGRPNYDQSLKRFNILTEEKSKNYINWGISVDVNLSISSIGYSAEVGYISDGKGNSSIYYSHGHSVGFEASIGINGIYIPNSNFNLTDFEGNSMSLNVSSIRGISVSYITDYSHGAEKDYYSNKYWGLKFGWGVGVGASLTHTRTEFFKFPKKDNTGVPVYYQRGHK